MAKRFQVNICKIRTDRLRSLSSTGLDHAYWRLLRSERSKVRAAQWGEGSPRGLLIHFLAAITSEQKARADTVGWQRAASREGAMLRLKLNTQEVERLERKIWDMQAKRKCSISPDELVARDAIRQGNIDQRTIDRLRGKRKPIIR